MTSTRTGIVESLLADMAGAPPADLSRLLEPSSGRVARTPSTVQRFTSGLGTSAVRVPLSEPVPPATRDLGTHDIPRLTGLGTSAVQLVAPPVEQPSEPSPSTDDSMPELFCPGPVRDDPALGEEVNERVVEWAGEVGIYPGELDHLRNCDFGRLIMLTHPATDDPDRLLAATKCVVAEWAADDYYIDEVDLGADPAAAASRMSTLNAIIDPAGLPAEYTPQLDEYRTGEPIATAFRSAMRHLAQYCSPTQLGRFQHQMTLMFTAWNHAIEWRAEGRMPAVWEYLVQRNMDSYLPPMILIDAVAGYELPATQFYVPPVRRAFTMAGLANVLLNDLHSAGRESDNDVNLPRVIALENGCAMREAIKRTVEIHNELMHTFVAEAALLSATDPTLRRFFTDVWAWLGGSREWHATTRRYHTDPADTPT
ncbi:2-methylisoborneol synthase [Herbihabitans rhizosphaerae]|uniref:2-methylisoborneol synthase n=1 Tax=Herbihabitans rhizosphaerae TaxID=1872711 RepID=A0A4V2EU58_9PSEU|nr:family 2 encapsulin nanocompartment cargo protein terpene cyclase [Herbihabitans rhizosphaerae]RZS43423.1 2-methylisoborneol synthase [Herbihabitans rhizosphaerae]